MTPRAERDLFRGGPAWPASSWGLYLHATEPVPDLVALARTAEDFGAAALVVPDEGTDCPMSQPRGRPGSRSWTTSMSLSGEALP